MSTTSPTRIDDELFDAARTTGALFSRSASQQIAHWARLGRELEASPSVSHRAVTEVLAGRARYDDLPAQQQASVRTHWNEQISARLGGLDLATDSRERGRDYAELDDQGRLVEHPHSSRS